MTTQEIAKYLVEKMGHTNVARAVRCSSSTLKQYIDSGEFKGHMVSRLKSLYREQFKLDHEELQQKLKERAAGLKYENEDLEETKFGYRKGGAGGGSNNYRLAVSGE